MAKLKSGTRIYGDATIDTSVVVGSAVTLSSSGLQVTGISTLNNANATQLSVTGVSTFTNGPILIGSGTSTGTASQRLQVTGGAYVSGNVGLGTINPTVPLHIRRSSGELAIFEVIGAASAYFSFISDSTKFGFVGSASGFITTGTRVDLALRSDNNLLFSIGSAEKLRLNSSGNFLINTTTATGTASQPLQVNGGAYVSGNLGIGFTNPSQSLHVQGNARVTGAVYDSTNSPGTSGQVLQSTVTGTQWTTAAAGGGGSGKFDTSIDNVVYVQPTGTLDIVGVGTTTTQITTLPAGSNKYLVHSIHVTNISNGDAEITSGFVMNARKVPATIVSGGGIGVAAAGIHTIRVSVASSIRIGMAVTGQGNIGETIGIGSTAGFQYNTYVTSVDGNLITLSKPIAGAAVSGTAWFSPVSKVSSRLPVPVGSAVELLKQPMVLDALDSIVLQSTGAGTGVGTTSTAVFTQTANSNIVSCTVGSAITNFIYAGQLVQGIGTNTGIQTNTFIGVGYTPGSNLVPLTRPATSTLASQTLSFTDVITPQDGALQATIVYQSSTDTSYLNGTGTVVGIVTLASQAVSGVTSTTPFPYYGTGNLYPSTVQSIRVSNISDGSIYPGGDYPVSVGIGNSDTVFSWLAYNMVIPRNSSIELCEAPKRLGIGQSIFALSNTVGVIEIQVAGKQKTT
jgi:hypothetical protein